MTTFALKDVFKCEANNYGYLLEESVLEAVLC
jgi:hypothetical protein